MIGRILGDRYELIEKIGEGGMAEVYKAKCNKLNRFNAIKILKAEFSSNPEIVDKFKREATAIANLNNPNIIGVLDVGSQDGINYIVMEYVQGKTLKQIIREAGKLSPERTVNIAIQIAKALDCAHKNNIIHRDIKPQNILITGDDIVKVSDFGIAKSISSATMTHTTSVMGSAHYFSPEQAKGAYLDARTDIYSLGVVMYEMTTGRLPFEADNPVAIALMHIQDIPRAPKDYTPNLPENLNALILKAMEKEPIKRYQSSHDVLLDLLKIKDKVSFNVVSNGIDDDFTRIMTPVNINNKPSAVEEDYEDEDDFEDGPNNKKKTVLLLVLISIVVLLLGALAGSFILKGNKKSDIVLIPQLAGLSRDEAEIKLREQELLMEVTEVNSEEEIDTVISVSPTEGTEVRKGSTVRVTISMGEEKVIVPDLTNYDINVAKQMITVSNLEVGDVTMEHSDSIEIDKVISQDPEGNEEVPKNTKVNLVVSLGKKFDPVQVPDLLVGITANDAKVLLEASELKLGTVSEQPTEDQSKDGKVISQSIPKGTSVAEETVVDVTVGKYTPPSIKFDEQGLIGAQYGSAKNQLSNIASRYKLTYEYKLDGKTIKTPEDQMMIDAITPTEAQEGSKVTITLKQTEPESSEDGD
ncbi:Stk1 family PASTA domain-containing Ser/Thr kinase [Alloiococcus sp. CFN-8]|uniref:Stk1 family PASTA domain-containing Ser/Thr kinase n=1 Tax=Alloiococcus sp. CFN-8 TaxID=3416081 RepID=UPI003CF2654C